MYLSVSRHRVVGGDHLSGRCPVCPHTRHYALYRCCLVVPEDAVVLVLLPEPEAAAQGRLPQV